MWILYFPEWANVPENLPLTTAQYFHQNTKLEAAPSVETCVNKIMKESPGRRQEHKALDNWKRLERQAPSDGLRQKIGEVERQFILVRMVMNKSSKIFQRISCQRERRRTKVTLRYWTVFVPDVVKILPILMISRSTLRCGANSLASAYELYLSKHKITKTSKGWRRLRVFQAHNICNSLCTDKWKHWSQRRIQYANPAGLEYTSTVKKSTLLGDLAAKLIRMKVHVLSDPTMWVGVSNPDPSNNWPKLQ